MQRNAIFNNPVKLLWQLIYVHKMRLWWWVVVASTSDLSCQFCFVLESSCAHSKMPSRKPPARASLSGMAFVSPFRSLPRNKLLRLVLVTIGSGAEAGSPPPTRQSRSMHRVPKRRKNLPGTSDPGAASCPSVASTAWISPIDGEAKTAREGDGEAIVLNVLAMPASGSHKRVSSSQLHQKEHHFAEGSGP